MKKTLLLVFAASTCLVASAQNMLNLNGSSYYQSFDNIGAGLPKGWEIDSLASSTSKGLAMTFEASTTAWNNSTAKGKNFAAKDTFSSTASSALQAAATNRAFGVRQTGNINLGVAFTLTIGQTQGLRNFNLAFNLQSLDAASPRTTTWEVQYGIGANPSSFTTVPASGTSGLITGNTTFSNSVVTASFGSALDSQTGPVVIRIVTLSAASGSGNRASSAIDSLTLSWTGTAVVYEPQLLSFTPANNATAVPLTTNLVLNFDKNITAGAGNIYLKNRSDQTSITKLASSSDVAISGTQATVSNLGLVLGKTYSVTFDTNAFMNGSFSSFGMADSTSWVFATLNPVLTLTYLNENFDAACATGKLPNGWSRQNVQGPGQEWNCYTPTGSTNAAMQMNGYMGGNNANEDWLITPRLKLAPYAAGVSFYMQKNFVGTEPDVLISYDYDGNSAPSAANWTSFGIPMHLADTGSFKFYMKTFLPSATNPYFFVGFKYKSTDTDGYRVRLDEVSVTILEGVTSLSSQNNNMPLQVLKAQQGSVQIAFNANNNGKMNASIFDLLGRQVYTSNVLAIRGENRVTLSTQDLPAGMYIIKLGNGQEQGVARTFIQ